MNPEVGIGYRSPEHYTALAQLRDEAPVHEYAPGRFTITRYADVREISRDPSRFCTSRGVLINDPARDGARIEGSILHMDPPAHGPWRQLVSRRFTPRAVSVYEPLVRATAGAVLDDLAPGDGVDFVDRISAPFPLYVIAALLGIGEADYADFRRWSDATIESPDNPGDRVEDVAELYRFLGELVQQRRAHPGDDLVSVIVGAEVEQRPLTAAEAVMYVLTLLIAGNETTRHLVSGTAVALSEHRDQQQQLASESGRIAGAVEEFLRWVTPVATFTRTATLDTEIGGVPIAADSIVALLYTSANRDERVFGPTADRFDVTRPFDNTHLAFGFGEHLCLGAALARLEARVMIEELLARFPRFAVAGEPTWITSTLVHGMARLPVTLH
jgi:cytochrome P450